MSTLTYEMVKHHDPARLHLQDLMACINSANLERARLYAEASEWRARHSQLAHEYERRMGETHDEAQWWADFNDSPL